MPGRELFHVHPGSSAPISRASLVEPGLPVLCELTGARLCLTITKPASWKGGGNGFKRRGETEQNRPEGNGPALQEVVALCSENAQLGDDFFEVRIGRRTVLSPGHRSSL